MPRFLSADWVAAFNEAVADGDVRGAGAERSLKAAAGSFRIHQLVHKTPDGATLGTVLTVSEGTVSLSLDTGRPPAGPADPDVTLSLDYGDAVALSRGELSAAAALTEGRIRVRGDLAVLVAGQDALAAVADRLAELRRTTSY